MNFLPLPIQNLIEEFSRLPGIGPKSAQRLTMHLLHSPKSRISTFSDAVAGLHSGIEFCRTCWNIAESATCKICADHSRNHHQICVVEEILDVVAIEKTLEYKGTYHVLHGALAPVDGIGPEQLKIDALVDRIKNLNGKSPDPDRLDISTTPGIGATSGTNFPDAGTATGITPLEIIIATNPGLEGETTAMYITRQLKNFPNLKITRIARGLPIGGDLDYADELTLSKALQGRAEYF